MRNRGDVLRALSQENVPELTERLIAFAAHRGMPDPEARVVRAMQEAMDHEHHHLYRRGLSLFAFLCHVIKD